MLKLIANVRTVFKKDESTKVKNYRSVSLLNLFSKTNEIYIWEFDPFLIFFFRVYFSSYSTNHLLIRLIKNWEKSLHQNNLVRAVLMDLIKALDCISRDLLIAKMHAYGFSRESLNFFHSYPKRGQNSVKINSTYSFLYGLLSSVPQGSILGQVIFNTFINNFYWVKESQLHKFVDDNAISSANFSVQKLLETPERENQIATHWFKKITCL